MFTLEYLFCIAFKTFDHKRVVLSRICSGGWSLYVVLRFDFDIQSGKDVLNDICKGWWPLRVDSTRNSRYLAKMC